MKAYQKLYHQRRKKSHKTVKISLRNEEYKKFQKQADQRKVSVATLLKQMAHSKLHSIPELTPVAKAKMDEMIMCIRSVSNNTNQVTHATNLQICKGEYPTQHDGINILSNIQRELVNLEELLRAKLH